MIQRYYKNNQLVTVFLSTLIFLLLLSISSSFSAINKDIQTQYLLLKNIFSPSDVSKNIIVVWIDEQSFQDIWQFPFDRTVYSDAVRQLSEYNVAAIWIDILLLDRSTEVQGQVLRDTFSEIPHIVLWASIDREGKLYLPEQEIFWWITDHGYVSPLVESSNRIVYSFRPLRHIIDYGIIEHFSIRILRHYYSYIFEQDYMQHGKYDEDIFHFSDRLILPLSAKNREEILIRFLPSSQFQYISFSDILEPNRLEELTQDIDFNDSIVIIWPAAQWLNDEFFTPVWIEYWVFVHANIINTVLTRQYLVYFDRNIEWVLIFCTILISVMLNFSKRSTTLLYWNISIISIFFICIPLFLLIFSNLIINFPFEILMSFLLSFWLANLMKYLIEDTNKERLWKALSEYVSTDIMQEVLNESWKVYLDGQKRELIVYFSDIENFTHMSEVLSPEELVEFLREYLSELTEILMKHGAYIDKYEWDAIMALWGAFDTLDNDIVNKVCEVLLEQEGVVKKISKKWKKKFWHELKVRSWVHLWEAIVWNIWAPGRKMNFTALWDTVNLASRLEWVNKYYHSYICLSEDLIQHASKEYIMCELDAIKVLWKDKAVKIFTLLGKEWNISPKLLIKKEQYEHALELYRKWDFLRAQELFEELSEEKFLPAKTLLERTQKFLTHPPKKNWDGTWTMEWK